MARQTTQRCRTSWLDQAMLDDTFDHNGGNGTVDELAALRKIHDIADLVAPDGNPLVWMSRRLGAAAHWGREAVVGAVASPRRPKQSPRAAQSPLNDLADVELLGDRDTLLPQVVWLACGPHPGAA